MRGLRGRAGGAVRAGVPEPQRDRLRGRGVMSLNAQQVEQLLKPVNPKRVQKDRDGMSHLAGYDVAAHLTRIFGFGGWEKHITSLELVFEREIKDAKRDRKSVV